MMNQEHKRPVTLEDLLRLKRAERPPAEFWSQFDRELRAKQLAAIVEKRPWWRTFPQVFGAFTRYHLPLGATAILAITVLTVREYRSAAPQTSASSKNVASAAMAMAPAAAFAREAASMREETVASVAENTTSADSSNLTVTGDATASAPLAPALAVLDTAPIAPEPTQQATPSTRFIAANFALAKAAAPAIAQNLLGSAHGFESRAMPARAPVVEPLAQMASPSDVRRSRLLNGATMLVSMNSAPVARTTELRSRQLSDEQLYETISRFGARGNSLLVKF